MDGIDSGNNHATQRRLTCSGLYPLVGDAKLVTVAMRCSGGGTVRFSDGTEGTFVFGAGATTI